MLLLVCDDNKNDLAKTMSLLSDCVYAGGCSIRGFHEPNALANYIGDGNEADALFLDIVMPGMNGISLAQTLRGMGYNGFIIYMSHVNDYAAQCYEVRAFSYLLKPLEKDEVQSVICKVEKAIADAKNSGIKLGLTDGGRFVTFKDLVYVEVRDHYLYFAMNSGEVIKIRSKLSAYSGVLLADSRMARCNRSFILNMDYINRCEDSAAFLKDGTRISIPRNFTAFQNSYLERMFGKSGEPDGLND